MFLHEILAIKTWYRSLSPSVSSALVQRVKRAAGLCVCLTEGGASYTYTEQRGKHPTGSSSALAAFTQKQ